MSLLFRDRWWLYSLRQIALRRTQVMPDSQSS